MFKKSGLGGQLKKLPRGPDLSELHQLLSQSFEQRGKPVKVTWRGANLTPFTLEVVCNLKNGNAQWRLFAEQNPVALFDYTSVDVLLIYNLVASHTVDAQQSPKNAEEGSLAASVSHHRLPAQNRLEEIPPAPPMEHEDSAVARMAVSNAPVQSTPAQGPTPPLASQNVSAHSQTGPLERSGQHQVIEAPVMVQSTISSPAIANTTVVPQPVAPARIPGEGLLKEGMLADLLNIIAEAKGTGRLDLRSKESEATVYFQEGTPSDATTYDAVGDDAIIEMLTWMEGTFTFQPQVLRNNHTVKESIASLLARSKKFAERLDYLKKAGLLPTSVLTPINTLLSQMDFVGRVSDNCPCDIETISRVYCNLDGNHTFEELQRLLQLSRVQLANITFHLLIKELIKLTNDDNPQNLLTLTPRPIDHGAIDSIMTSLRRPDTGLFIYPAFLYFLEQEYFRSYRSRTSFSVVVFELRQRKVIDGKTVRRVLDERALMDAVLRISHIKRHVDLIAHFDAYDYALLLPSTRTQGAEIFIGRVIEALKARPLGEVDPSQLSMAFGCSSVPEDFKDMSALLGAASLAMEQSRETGKPMVMYRDIKNMVR